MVISLSSRLSWAGYYWCDLWYLEYGDLGYYALGVFGDLDGYLSVC